jgi:O-antigen ligase
MSSVHGFSDQDSNGRVTSAYFGLVVILAIMLGGALPSLLYAVSRNAIWIVWGLEIVLLFTLGLQLALPMLILPAMPLMAWLAVYICWGTLAAPYPILLSGFRLWVRFFCIIASMAVVTSHSRRLAFFASSVQWVLVANLIVTAWLMAFPEHQQDPFFLRLDATLESDRFAGLWGDANQAGLVALFILVLSHWAKPWVAWVGRVSGALIIYLTASRTAFWIAIALTMLYFFFVAGKKSIYHAAMLALAFILLGVGILNSPKVGDIAFIKDNPNLSRVFDLSESKTREKGEGSRLDLAEKWLPIAARQPWFGNGLYSSEGDASAETMVKRGLPNQGTHNLYLALFIDDGWVGLLLFMGIIIFQLIKIWQAPLTPEVHKAMFALCFVILVFSLTSHQMVTDYPGWMGFSLIFLLPTSPALRDPLPI